MRSILESVRDYAIYMLDRDGYVITWNLGGERIQGYTSEEILGKHFSRFFTQKEIGARSSRRCCSRPPNAVA